MLVELQESHMVGGRWRESELFIVTCNAANNRCRKSRECETPALQ